MTPAASSNTMGISCSAPPLTRNFRVTLDMLPGGTAPTGVGTLSSLTRPTMSTATPAAGLFVVWSIRLTLGAMFPPGPLEAPRHTRSKLAQVPWHVPNVDWPSE